MRTFVLGALWFTLVLIVALLWCFPVDALVAAQLQQTEERTGIRVRWGAERWSIWRSRVENVTVTDRTGHEWLRLSDLEVSLRPSGLSLLGRAAWGTVGATIAPDAIAIDLDGYPVPTPPSKAIEEGRLQAHVVLKQANSSAHGTFNLSGRGRILVYEGPIGFDGSFEASPQQAQTSVEVHGDRLRGHGDLTITPAGSDWSHAQIEGPLRIEQKGTSVSLRVSGPLDGVTINAQ